MKHLCHYRARIREEVTHWWVWKVTGWPFKKRCPQCAGSGTYLSDVQARYGDEPKPCDMCGGTGKVKR